LELFLSALLGIEAGKHLTRQQFHNFGNPLDISDEVPQPCASSVGICKGHGRMWRVDLMLAVCERVL
jgi:hypothetical protein